MAASTGHERHEKTSLAFGSVVTEELVAMLAAPFVEVVVAPKCLRDRCGHDRAEGRAEVLLQVDT